MHTSPAAMLSPHTSATAYIGISLLALLAYAAYWAVLRRALPQGKPQRLLLDRRTKPRLLKVHRAVVAAELCIIFLLPWAGAAASGAWAAAGLYFGPVAAMTVVDICAEFGSMWDGHTLAVYASTGANNLWQLCAYFCALLDMAGVRGSRGPGEGGAVAAALLPLQAVAWAGVAISCVIILLFEPCIVALIPVEEERKAD